MKTSRAIELDHEVIVAAVDQYLRSLSITNDDETVIEVAEETGGSQFIVSIEKEKLG